MAQDDPAPLRCACDSTDFARVIVEREGRAPLTSPFVACKLCGAVYKPSADWLALEHSKLMDDVRAVAADYRKPGREFKIGDPRRKNMKPL